MKRFFAIFAVLALLLTGCAGSPSSSVVLPPCFNSEAEITVGDTAYGVYLTRYAPGCWQVELNQPAAVKGLLFTVKDGGTEVSYDGLRFTFDTSRFPVGSVVAASIDSLDRLFASPVEVIEGEEQCLAAGKIGEESYTLSLSKTMIPQKLELADKMTIEFLSFDVIQTES